jgi:methionine-rich copper-binding protein CopC
MYTSALRALAQSKLVLQAAVPLLIACAATSAFAHAQLKKATPAVGGTVASANEIRLNFSEGVEPRFSGVALTSGGGADMPLGAARVEPGHQEVLIVPIAKPLSPGVYTVHWHAVSVDTHHTQGDFQFTVK